MANKGLKANGAASSGGVKCARQRTRDSEPERPQPRACSSQGSREGRIQT